MESLSCENEVDFSVKINIYPIPGTGWLFRHTYLPCRRLQEAEIKLDSLFFFLTFTWELLGEALCFGL